MISVELHQELAAKLSEEATRRQTTLDGLVNRWLQESLWRDRLNKIREESRRFESRHSELYKQFAGKHIAMLNGVVLDHDDELLPLYQRVRAKYGDEPVLITPVTREAIPTYRVLSPKRLALFLDGPQAQTEILDDAMVSRLRARRDR